MNLTKTQLIIVAAAGAVILIFALIFLGVLPGLQTSSNNPANIKASLNFWGIGDTADAYAGALAAFKISYPNVTIAYRGFDNADTYHSSLLDALAASQGPDIFMVRNTDLPKNQNKIMPVSPNQFSPVQLKQYFPQVVAQDFISQNGVYALPLSIDTLALIYNRDLFDQAAVSLPGSRSGSEEPSGSMTWQSWEDFLDAVPKLTKKSANGEITQSAAAIGGSNENVRNANDLLYLLMLQSGAKISDSQTGLVSFASKEGIQALNFYAQFSHPTSQAYAWNKSLPFSLDAFGQGKVAMVFGYASDLSQIKSRNNFLNFEIAPMPQPKAAILAITYPSYWGYVVSRQSQYQSLAWKFILGMTTNEATAKGYIQKTQKPPALNSLIYQYQNDPALGVFARQALTARSWFEADRKFIDQAISGMINSVVNNNVQPKDALEQTQNQINQFITR